MKKLLLSGLLLLSTVGLAGCPSDADVASRNISTAADNFEINRRVIFYNGITGEVMLLIEGRCSLGNTDTASQRTVTCKTGDSSFVRHHLGLSDNVTYMAEQLEGVDVSAYNYRFILKPESLIPDFEINTSSNN